MAVDAFPCGSRSTSRTAEPLKASPAAKLTTEVVFPTPPFWLATAMTRPPSPPRVSRETGPGGAVGLASSVITCSAPGPVSRETAGEELAPSPPGTGHPRPAGWLCCGLAHDDARPVAVAAFAQPNPFEAIASRRSSPSWLIELSSPHPAISTTAIAIHGRRRGVVTATTVAGWRNQARPHCRTSPRAPAAASSVALAASSAVPAAPLSASSEPPGWSNGNDSVSSLGKGATARANATSNLRPVNCSARACTTSTRSSLSAATHSCKKAVRRRIGSINTMSRSGRSSATTIPGSPAPDPRSATLAAPGTSSATAAQLRRWRAQIRAPSRGPKIPRSTAVVDSSSAYRRASGKADPKAIRATGGGDSTVRAAVDPGGATELRGSRGDNDDVPVGLNPVSYTHLRAHETPEHLVC